MPLPRLLLVDDDVAAGPILAEWVGRQGYDVTYADGPAAATAALRGPEFELILSDIQMPGNHRLEWIERLFRAEQPPPVVLMTGNPELETAMRAANLPIAAYLLKPLDLGALAATMTRLVQRHRQQGELRAAARDIARWLEEAGPLPAAGDAALASRFHALVRTLTTEASRDYRAPADREDAPWREAVADAIVVLEKTKHSFRSRELGQLRARLERFLRDPATAAAGVSAV